MNYSPIYSPFGAHLFLPLIAVALVWTLVLKGFALWYAARGDQKWWFFFLLIVNSLGILEIIYLIWFRPETDTNHPHIHHSHDAAHHSSAA